MATRRVICPGCQTTLKLPESSSALKIKCPKCAKVISIGPVAPAGSFVDPSGLTPPAAPGHSPAGNVPLTPFSISTSQLPTSPQPKKPAQDKPKQSSNRGLLKALSVVGGGLAVILGVGIAGIGIYYLLKANKSNKTSIALGEEVPSDLFPATNDLLLIDQKPFDVKKMDFLYPYGWNRCWDNYGTLTFFDYPSREEVAYTRPTSDSYDDFTHVTQKHVIATSGSSMIILDRNALQEIKRDNSGSREDFNAIAVSPDGLLGASQQGSSQGISIWEVTTGKELKFIDLEEFVLDARPEGIAFSPDSKQIAYAFVDRAAPASIDDLLLGGYMNTTIMVGITQINNNEGFVIPVENLGRVKTPAVESISLQFSENGNRIAMNIKSLDASISYTYFTNNFYFLPDNRENFIVDVVSRTGHTLPDEVDYAYFVTDDILLVQEERVVRERGEDKWVKAWHFRRINP
jgi:hypothetical protein